MSARPVSGLPRRSRAARDDGPAADGEPAAGNGAPAGARARDRPLAVTGAMAAAAVAATGLGTVALLVLVGWIAAPDSGTGLGGVLRTAVLAWLIGHHVGFSLPGAGPIGLLPLGLVLLPGALLWRAGRWVVRSSGVTGLRQVGTAALALAAPYAMLAAALAMAAGSRQAVPSLPEAVICPFGLAFLAGGLGGARALAPWGQLAGVLSVRVRSLTIGTLASLAVLSAAGALIAGVSLALHLAQFRAQSAALGPGPVGAGLLLLGELAYTPNAVVWAISFALGPGFAFGAGTVMAPTGSAMGRLPSLPLLAALPTGVHAGLAAPLSVAVIAAPYLAGVAGGLASARMAPLAALEIAPLWGLACGTLTGAVLAAVTALSGGSLGSGRLSAVGPSAWQAGLVAALEVGVAGAVVAGLVNWRRLRAAGASVKRLADAAGQSGPDASDSHDDDDGDGHVIYLDPWAESGELSPADDPAPAWPGPASLPDR